MLLSVGWGVKTWEFGISELRIRSCGSVLVEKSHMSKALEDSLKKIKKDIRANKGQEQAGVLPPAFCSFPRSLHPDAHLAATGDPSGRLKCRLAGLG